jgi:hypothetical protein
VSFRPEEIAKLPLTMAYSVSPSERGSCAASSGMNFSFFGFSATSFSEARSGSMPALMVISLFCSSSTSARARLLGSFGSVTRSPSFTSASVLRLVEYTPMGAIGPCTSSVMSSFWSAANFFR